MRTIAPKTRSLLCAAALLTAVSCNQDENEDQRSITGPPALATASVSAYDIVKVGGMTVDGNLSDWSGIAAISMADDPDNGRGSLNNSASVKLAWDDVYLYAVYDVADTELLALQTTRDHGDIYKDDEVELYIDPQGDGGSATSMTATDYQFLANVREALGDNRGTGTASKDASYNAASFLAKAATNGTLNATGADVGYTVELRISWSDLGVTPTAGHFMRLNLAVGDRDGSGPPPVQTFDWAGLTNYNNPSAWKDVQLVNPPPPVSAYDIVKVGAMTIDGNLSDWSGIAVISIADDPDNGRGSLNNSASVKLAWNNTYLYAAYDVTDTELLAVQSTRDHGDIHKDDEVELYIDPQGDGGAATSMTATDFQFLANVRDALGDLRGNGTGGKDASYNAASFLAKAATNGTLNASGTDVGYTVELQISWSDLGVTPSAGHFMRIDLAVGDRDGSGPPPVQTFDWAGLTNYNNPSAWKNVKLENSPPPSEGAALRFGLFAMQGRIGEGPGGDTGAPIYPVAFTNQQPSGINAEIATADAKDVVLVANLARSRGRWTHSETGPCQGPPGSDEGDFVWSCYEASVREHEGNATLADAIQRKRVLLYVVDEPNTATFGNSFTPTLVNDAAQLHKEIWPTALTFVRVAPSILRNGWRGLSLPTNGWTGVDYAWVQYSGFSHRTNVTPAQQLINEKDHATSIDVGVTASLNLWAAGIQHDFDGVTGCWDYADNNISNGIVQGTPAGNGWSEGEQVPCANFTLPNSSNVMANPDWIKHYADVVSQDPDIPFALAWTYPEPNSGAAWGTTYINRADMVTALNYAITKSATRTDWVGYREPKPWDGVPR